MSKTEDAIKRIEKAGRYTSKKDQQVEKPVYLIDREKRNLKTGEYTYSSSQNPVLQHKAGDLEPVK